jgi:ABC-type (unclassified) transport system, ATPase component
MQDLLEVDSVIKSYDLRQILTDVYVKCVSGDIIGLLGRNGIGKSTMLKIIFGTLVADNKFIRINQQVIDKPYLKKDLINYLPQDGFLPVNLTVKQVVGLYFNDSTIILDDEILNKVINTRISNLSGGEGRYLEIKMLLFSKSKFVLLDEPFNGVAPILIDSIKDLIKKQSISKGIILTDHDYRNVLDVANRYYLMFDGGLKEITDKNELIDWGYIPESKR